MATALADNGAEGGKVLMLEGSPLDNNVPMVRSGFLGVCEERGMTIADAINCDGWRAELAAEHFR